MVYTSRIRGNACRRPRAFWGALIPAAINFVGGLITSSQQAKAQKRALEEQQRLAQQQLQVSNQNNLATTLNNYASANNSYSDEDYNLKYRNGGTRRLGSNGITITDGGTARKIGNNTYLLRGGSHEDINETGQTGIGINVGGNEIEAEGGEVAQRKGNSLRIYSAQPILGGISPAQAIIRGYNKDKVFAAQQRFKKNNGIKDDGSKAAFGNLITMPFASIVKDVVDYFSNSGKYAPKRVKVSNKTVNKKPIRNGQVGNFRVVNGRRISNEKPLRQVYPEFDVISMGRGLPIKRSLKNTVGFVSKPNTFTRGIGNREGIKDLVESKVVRGNPVGTEMTAKAYTKATKSNRNSFNDIMNGTGREGISHRYYNRSLSKEDFDAIRESYNKINASFKARHPKASGNIRFAIGDDVYDPLGNYKNYDDYLAQIASDRKTLRNATTINPDNGEPIAYFYNDGRNPLTQGHGYASSKWGVRISNPQDYNMKIFDGHLHYSNSRTIPFDSPNVEVFRSTPFGTIRYPKWMLRRGWYRNGGLTSKDRGSSKHPYPSVSSKDFAGGNRSYPIPTKADAVDALRLAGLHGRNDVRSKVYSRYPELRKKAEYGVNIDPYRNYSTTYKNKTSRGNKLSIRNGVVFLNNKRAPKGYKWFDKGNSTTYLVGNDGRFSIYQIHGKKPLERIDFNDDNYVAEANSRLELSNNSPNLPLYKADAQVWKDVLAKDKLERKHIIPNRLPNVRSIKLNTKEIQTNNKGKKFSNFKGVEIPINLIDSVYKWTKEANQPLVNGFGLLGETNAGNTAPMSEDPNTKGYSNKVVRNNSGRYVSYIRPTELVNHHQFWLGPTSNLINYLIRNGKVKDNIFESGSNAINYLPTDASYIKGDKKTYNEVNNALRYIKKDTSNPNPFINALDYFKTGKYHIDKNYNNKVKERGRDFMTDKNVQKRINYIRKNNMYKCGGRIKATFGDWVRTNRHDNALANLLYESGIIDKNAWRNMLRDIYTFTGMGSDPYNDNQDEAVLTPAFGSSSTRVLSQLSKSPEASYTLKQVLGLPTKEMVRKRIAGDIAKRIGVARTASQSSNFRNYNIARMQAANAEASFNPFANQVRYAEGKPILVNTNGYYTTAGNTISRNAKNMTSGANPFLYAYRTSDEVLEGLGRVISNAKQGAKNVGQRVGNNRAVREFRNLSNKDKAKYIGMAGFAATALPAVSIYLGNKLVGKDNKTTSVQKDAHGQPISPYIARPQEPAKSQAKKSVPARKDTTRTDTTRTDTTKQVNKVVKRQVRTTPQYTGNTTKGNYQLHDGETKVINGVKYTRRGNTIINHKTNVGYIYDKNGNYTGQADYSKVGNFNQAFDAARAAGRSQFIYRAGKYNNYSTAKETNAKKEALNRRVGAKRIAKRMGGLTNTPVGRFKCGGRIRPKAEDGMLAPIYSYGTDRRRLPSFATIDVTPRAIPNFKHISVPINTKTPFDPNSVPFLGNQSTFKPATQDYIGLGIDTLAALGSGMFTRSAYNKMNFDYALPNYVDESPVAFDTIYHNEAQRANVERNRLNSRNLIRDNTSSAQTALGRMQQTDIDAMMELNKLADEKANKEVELRNQNAANEQQVRARNAAARNQYYQNVAQIKNATLEAKNNAALAKAQSIGADLSGLSQAWTNFAGSVEQRYNTRQNEAIIAATSKEPAVLSNALQFGYNFSPEVLASIYRSTNDDKLKQLALSRLSPSDRRRYSLFQ